MDFRRRLLDAWLSIVIVVVLGLGVVAALATIAGLTIMVRDMLP